MYVPGVGLFSRTGCPYEPGVLPHIEAALAQCTLWLDGELYSHGMSLQQINARAGVVRAKPHADHAAVSFNIIDSPHIAGGFEHRQNTIRDYLRAHVISDCARQLDFRDCSCATSNAARTSSADRRSRQTPRPWLPSRGLHTTG